MRDPSKDAPPPPQENGREASALEQVAMQVRCWTALLALCTMGRAFRLCGPTWQAAAATTRTACGQGCSGPRQPWKGGSQAGPVTQAARNPRLAQVVAALQQATLLQYWTVRCTAAAALAKVRRCGWLLQTLRLSTANLHWAHESGREPPYGQLKPLHVQIAVRSDEPFRLQCYSFLRSVAPGQDSGTPDFLGAPVQAKLPRQGQEQSRPAQPRTQRHARACDAALAFAAPGQLCSFAPCSPACVLQACRWWQPPR